MDEFDDALHSAQSFIEEEAQKEQRLKLFNQEEESFNYGKFYRDPTKYREYVQKGHKPTFNSCVGDRNILESPFFPVKQKYDVYKNPHFEEIFEIACTNGLSKEDAEQLFKFAFSAKSIGILVEKGKADIQKYPVHEINEFYAQVIGKKEVNIRHVATGYYEGYYVRGYAEDNVLAEGIENSVREILKRGYDIQKSPQQAEALRTLLTNIKARHEEIERQEALLLAEQKRREDALRMEQEQKRNGTFYKVDDVNKLITYDPNKNNHGETDNTINEATANMVEIANKTGYNVQTTFNGVAFQVLPGMTSDEACSAYNLAFKRQEEERQRIIVETRKKHFQVNYDVYIPEIRQKVQKILNEIDRQFSPNDKSQAKLSQDKDHNIICTNDDGSLRWVWNPNKDVLKKHNVRAECSYKDFNYEDLTNNEIASLRRRLAKKADKALGTNLTKKKLPKSLKKLEKTVSDKLLGKTRE